MTARTTHAFPVRVYYEDTDFSGVVYHASYLRFMERGRTEMLRARGVAQGAFSPASPASASALPCGPMTIDFRRPARMDDMLTVETEVVEIGGASMELAQRVKRGDELLIDATVRIACVAEGRPCRIPAAIRASLGF